MEAACFRHTAIPGTSRLFTDFLYHYDRVRHFYEAGRRPAFPEDRRAALVAALAEQNPGHPSLEALGKPDTVAYVTGQQVGLFSGPAYTIYKALTAVRLARESNAQGISAVPIFWLASEDHDFVEVNHVWAFDRENRPAQVSMHAHPDPGRPVGGIEVAEWPVDELRAAFGDLPFADEVIEIVRDAYRPGVTMASAFRALLEKLLAPYGILFLDPLHSSIRKLAAPLLREALQAGPELTGALLERNKELEVAGYHAQVHVEPKTSPFFLLDSGKRIPLRRANGFLMAGNRRYTAGELMERADEISPNALLRPVVQDYMLPTAGYVGGPAEIAYFAQSQVLYGKLLGYMPRVLSRCGFTLLDARTVKLMSRYKVTLPDFFHGEEALKEKLAAALVPPALDGRVNALKTHIEGELDELHAAVREFDPTLGDAVAKSRSKMLYQLTKTSAKIARESLRRDAKATSDAEYLYNGLYRHKHLQERLYTILPFLAKHGLDLIGQIYGHAQVECPDHVLLSL